MMCYYLMRYVKMPLLNIQESLVLYRYSCISTTYRYYNESPDQIKSVQFSSVQFKTFQFSSIQFISIQ